MTMDNRPQQPYNDNYFIEHEEIEQVIQAILAAKDALEKPIVERDERDILLIDNLCSLVHGFDAFPETVRRALAAQAVLIIIDERGKELIVHNEELDSFCVLIFGECEQLNVAKTIPIRRFKVGDAFGVDRPTTETIRFVGHMVTTCDSCAFLCVKRDDFYTILTDPANYPRDKNKEIIRHRDRNGNVICVSKFRPEQKAKSNHIYNNNPFKIVLPDGHQIIKATEACLLLALVDGYDRIDSDYIDDFLLLFRVFMTHDSTDKEKKLPPGMMKLCLHLTKWLDHIGFRDKVVKIVLTWISSYYHDFELNTDFSYLFFKVLESRLLNLSMNNQLHLLHVTLSTKSKVRHVTISRSSREQPLSFAISGGYEKNCGIFVTQVYGSSFDDSIYESLMKNLEQPIGLLIPPRHRPNNNLLNQDSKNSAPLRPGDQILEVNGINFAAIKLVEAQKKLDMSTHLSLTVKYNPSAFHEMRALPEGRRKSSLSSMSSVSPYQPSTGPNKFTFTTQDSNKQNDYPPSSPLFSSNKNFGFRSIIYPKGDRSRLSSLINSSKQLVKQIRESTTQASTNSIETMSKTSDNISDDQSNDMDMGRAKSNPDLPSMKRDRTIESCLSNIVRSDDFNSTSNGSNRLVNVLRVFNAANNESRYLLIHEETTAREVVMVAVKEFNLTGNSGSHSLPGDKPVSSLNWHLYEVSVAPESKTIKQKCLSEQTCKLAERSSLCSRFYIKNNSQGSIGPSRLDMGDDTLVSEILKESPANVTLTSLNATLLAVELTLADFDKFKSIEPQQFVYDIFFDYSEKNTQHNGSPSTDSASMNSSSSDGQDASILHMLNKSRSIPKSWMNEYQQFANVSNKEMFWVICEILNERNIGRRVKIVKQFVRIADVCSQLRNYNSMFAIISGLSHSCVNRLKRTFDKLKPKYKYQLEKMRGLFDPYKNMSSYRLCLDQTPPPAIPIFPVIKKDLTFTKEGRSIFVRESNDLSDDDDVSGSYSQDTIKRNSRGDLQSVKSANADQVPFNSIAGSRSISYNSFNRSANSSNTDRILVNFSEIRRFTELIRNVIYFSSVPYSNDLLTNTKENQRTQAQIKKMHEEWQMRKRIRHYIDQTLNNANVDRSSCEPEDQVDGQSSKDGNFTITYDENALYQRSLEVEPEINIKPPVIERQNHNQSTQPNQRPTMQSQPPILPQVPPAALNMHPPLPANSSPTLSKSSSLSSCSSFSHHLPNYHGARGNLVSSVGKFGTESTESLRKLQALREDRDVWRPYNNGGNANNGHSRIVSEAARTKSRIFPPKGGR